MATTGDEYPLMRCGFSRPVLLDARGDPWRFLLVAPTALAALALAVLPGVPWWGVLPGLLGSGFWCRQVRSGSGACVPVLMLRPSGVFLHVHPGTGETFPLLLVRSLHITPTLAALVFRAHGAGRTRVQVMLVSPGAGADFRRLMVRVRHDARVWGRAPDA